MRYSTAYVLKHPKNGYYHTVFTRLAQDLQVSSRIIYKNTAESLQKKLERETGIVYTVQRVRVSRETGFMEEIPEGSLPESASTGEEG